MTRLVFSALLVLATLGLSATAQEAESEPSLEPDYGHELARGGVMLSIKAVDAAGEPLREAPDAWFSGSVWRRWGEYQHGYTCGFKKETSTFTCNGAYGAGLEPGRYTLQLRGGIYGTFERELLLRRGEPAEFTAEFPGRLRVVKLRFQNADGEAIAAVAGQPRFEPEPYKYKNALRYSAPDRILRDAPGHTPKKGPNSAVGLGGGIYPSYPYLTEEGVVYVAACVGIAGKIVVPLKQRYFGSDSITYEGPFEDEKWDDFAVTLAPTDEYAEWINGKATWNPSDPGNASLVRAVDPFDPSDEASVTEGRTRLILELDNNRNYPVFAYLRLGGFTPRPDWVSKDRNTWVWNDVPRQAEARFVIRDENTSASNAVLEFIELPDVSIHRHKIVLDQAILNMAAASPTVAACRGCRLIGGEDPGRYAADPDRWFSRRLLSPPKEAVLLKVPTGRLVTEDFAGGSWEGTVELNEKQLLAMSKDRVCDVPYHLPGLWFRVVDESGAGVPWAEACLHPLEEDEVAQSMLLIESALDQRRPRQGDVTAEMRDAVLEKEPSNEELRRILGDTLWGLYETRDQRLRLARCGTWYDACNRAKGDLEGFFHDRDIALESGKRYALYLWAHSRNDLLPDRRVVFEAKEGITDLGLFRIPAPKKD